MKPQFDLEGKCALITGASGGSSDRGGPRPCRFPDGFMRKMALMIVTLDIKVESSA